MTKTKLNVVSNVTCHSAHAQNHVDCQRQSCRQWIDHGKAHNCVLIAIRTKDSHTLQEIGQIYGLTRMRICQIEKSIHDKIKSATT